MSVSELLTTIRAFPRGRTTQELLVLIGAGMSRDAHVAALVELERLTQQGLAQKGRDGRWRAMDERRPETRTGPEDGVLGKEHGDARTLPAAVARFSSEPRSDPPVDADKAEAPRPDPHALLRYWRAALNADPRGARTYVPELHGIEWSLIAGSGPIIPADGCCLRVAVDLAAFDPVFQEALLSRERHERVLALGWPMAVSGQSGVPVLHPVGLIAATWERQDGTLVVTVETNSVVVNPAWVRTAARDSGWTRAGLADLFSAEGGGGLRADAFATSLATAMNGQIRGRLAGAPLATRLDVDAKGIHDSAAIFLPTGAAFTNRAARDLDRVSTWPRERLAQTALAPVLDIGRTSPAAPVAPVNPVALNSDQLSAVRAACDAPLTVLTGPPGSGKGDAILSMVASVLAEDGSVLVTSRCHRALARAGDRLGTLAPDLSFLLRVPDAEATRGTALPDALAATLEPNGASRPMAFDPDELTQLIATAQARSRALETRDRIAELQRDISKLLKRIERLRAQGDEARTTRSFPPRLADLLRRVLSSAGGMAVRAAVSRARNDPEDDIGLRDLQKALAALRAARQDLDDPGDPAEMGRRIEQAARRLFPAMLGARTHLHDHMRRDLAARVEDWALERGRTQPPYDLFKTVVAHRPIWLASTPGTPACVPLEDGLFDLVIFVAAGQCDIATAIPILARAKRAVVAGDAEAVPKVPQAGSAHDHDLMQAQGLPPGGMGRFAQSRLSLLDMVTRVPGARNIALGAPHE